MTTLSLLFRAPKKRQHTNRFSPLIGSTNGAPCFVTSCQKFSSAARFPASNSFCKATSFGLSGGSWPCSTNAERKSTAQKNPAAMVKALKRSTCLSNCVSWYLQFKSEIHTNSSQLMSTRMRIRAWIKVFSRTPRIRRQTCA